MSLTMLKSDAVSDVKSDIILIIGRCKIYIKIIYICTVDVNHLLLTSGKQLIGLLCRFRLKQDYCYEKPVLEM